MYSKLALALLAGTAWAIPAPQGVHSAIAPSGSPLCSADYSGTFEISAVTTTSLKRDIEKRACGAPGALVISLANGVLTDSKGRTGYIAANYQFQFDKPPQAGAIYTTGFSACSNGSLALGNSAVFWQCLSGNFFNLYDRDWASQCRPILLQILPCSGGGNPVVTQISDGQPQAASATPITQLSDGQPQGPTAPPVTVVPITQISDGQVQAPTSTPARPVITQISDGQIQAPTTKPGGPVITQISDGQVQAPTTQPGGPIITQISDGQVQAPTSTAGGAVVTQASEGQVQAPTTPAAQAPTSTSAGAIVTQISNGQVQAPTSAPAGTGTAPTVTPPAGNVTTGVRPQPSASQTGTNAASSFGVSSSLIAIAFGALAVLLL